jgi:hypothetical protein
VARKAIAPAKSGRIKTDTAKKIDKIEKMPARFRADISPILVLLMRRKKSK